MGPEQRAGLLGIALDAWVGAACTAQSNFEYAVSRPGKTELLKAKEIGLS